MAYGTYVSKAEKELKAQKSREKLLKKKANIEPVILNGTKIAETWWGKAWNKNLESYSDYENRIDRGRTYVRSGAVIDLKVAPGLVTALVQGSRAKPYDVKITIDPLKKAVWDKIIQDSAGKIESLTELIEGKFPKALGELFTAQKTGLFPTPREIHFSCSCPDYAYMCKHVAAALYGIGNRLDKDPSLFFTLRNINIDDLIKKTIDEKSQAVLKNAEEKSERALDDDDIGALFGIDMNSNKK